MSLSLILVSSNGKVTARSGCVLAMVVCVGSKYYLGHGKGKGKEGRAAAMFLLRLPAVH